MISKPLAKQLFPSTEAIGERVTVTLDESREQEFTIVGVSADVATSQLTTERPQILLPLSETFTPTVQLIACGAPGDEPKLKAALESVLRGVMEPPIYALASTIAVFVALLAGLPAARRATSVQPMVAIRSE